MPYKGAVARHERIAGPGQVVPDELLACYVADVLEIPPQAMYELTYPDAMEHLGFREGKMLARLVEKIERGAKTRETERNNVARRGRHNQGH